MRSSRVASGSSRRRCAALCVALLAAVGCGGPGEIGDDPRTAGDALARGRQLSEDRDFSAAIAPLLEACGALESCRTALPLLAESLTGSRQPESGVELLSRIIERYPELEAEALSYRGDMLDESLEVAQAERDYLRALELAPETRARIRLGKLLMASGRPAEAVELYRTGVELDPADTELRYRWGAALRVVGESARARELLEQVVEELPESAAAWLELGRVELDEHRPEAAVVAFRRAAELDTGAIEARYMLARQALRDGRMGAVASRMAEIEQVENRFGRARPPRP